LWIAKRCSPARVRWRRAAKRRALARSAPFCSPDVGATGGSGGNEDRTEALENKVYTKLLTLPQRNTAGNYSSGEAEFLLALRKLSPPSRKISEFSTGRLAVAIVVLKRMLP
jgi:hypothetical protein